MTQLWVPSSSPLFLYSPSNLVSETLQGQWVSSLAADQPAGAVNQSLWTATASAAILFPSIYCTSFTPVFNAQSGWTITLGVNSQTPQSWAPGQVWTGNKLDPNTFLLQFECTSGDCSQTPISFGGGTIVTQMTQTGTPQQVELDDSAPGPTYSGTFAEVGTGGAQAPIQVTREDSGSTLSWTGTAGASVSVTFQGSAIAIYGVTGPSLGNFGATIDGSLVATLSARSDVEIHNTLLYFSTLLDPAVEHTFTIQALDSGAGGQTGLVVDRWVAWGEDGKTQFIGNGSPPVPASPSVAPVPASAPPPFPAVAGSSASPSSTIISPAGPLSNGTNPNPPGAAVDNSKPPVGAIIGGVLGGLAALVALYVMFRVVHAKMNEEKKKTDPWDEANMLQNVKNEGVHVTTVANQRYVYPGMIAHSQLK